MSIDRIIELETKLSYQEDTITQLNDVVCRQQNQIDEINKIGLILLIEITKYINKIKVNMMDKRIKLLLKAISIIYNGKNFCKVRRNESSSIPIAPSKENIHP